jgi:hypothetical protein
LFYISLVRAIYLALDPMDIAGGSHFNRVDGAAYISSSGILEDKFKACHSHGL